MLQVFRKTICLVKEFYLVNSFIGVFLKNITTSFTAVTLQNITHFWYFFIILSVCCFHLFLYYLTTPLWNCVSASQICWSRCYVENFNLQIPHHHFCWRSLKIQCRSLKVFYRNDRSSPYNFIYVNLVSAKPKQIHIKKLLIKGCKKNCYRDVNVNKTS